ncbi:MAG: metal-dependent transcriptional regulator [Spirochaetota bacterium]
MSITTENYLKTIFAASESADAELVSLGELAQSLNVTPGTVTTMMKSLADAGLVVYRPRAGVMLTGEGKDVALGVVRRHRLLELFLVEVLGLDWSQVHEEAEELEHAISDRLLERIDEILGHPSVDPHGDPIPTAEGSLPDPVGRPLSEVHEPDGYCVARVDHDQASFLDYLKETGLVPGAQIDVRDRSDAAGTLVVEVGGRTVTLSLQVARKIHVKPTGC